MSAAIVAGIDELVERLARFSAAVGRDVELLVGDDGSLTMTVAEDTSGVDPELDDGAEAAFEGVAMFESVAGLLTYLEGGKL